MERIKAALIAFVLLVGLGCNLAFATITLHDHNIDTQNGTFSMTYTLGSLAVTAGDTIHITSSINYYFTGNIVSSGLPCGMLSLTDTLGNTYSRVYPTTAYSGGGFGNGIVQEAWYVSASVASGTASFNVTMNTGCNGAGGTYQSFGSISMGGISSAALDLGTTPAKQTTATPSLTAGPTAAPNEVVIGELTGLLTTTPGTVTEDSGNGFTTQNDDFTVAAYALHQAAKIVSSTGNQTYAPTVANSNDLGISIVTYKAGSPPVVTHLLVFPRP